MVVLRVGAVVSRVNLLVPSLLLLPTPSVAVADTLMVPSPKVVRSAVASVTAWEAPVPVTVLVTVLVPLVKVTAMLELDSPLTVTTPLAWVASAAVAPPVTPMPRLTVGVAGGVVSTASTSACNSARVSTPEPSSRVAAMACCTAVRLSAVTPVMPKASNWALVGAVFVATAPLITAWAAVARVWSKVTVLTLSLVKPSTTSPRRLALGVVRPVTPTMVYGAAVSGAPPFAVPSAPLRISR